MLRTCTKSAQTGQTRVRTPSLARHAEVAGPSDTQLSMAPFDCRPCHRVNGAPVIPCSTTEAQTSRLVTCQITGSASLCSIADA